MDSSARPSATSLFLRYRETGDAVALTGVFDQTAPELLALAGHLTRSLADAEDLVQHTFLIAIEKARKFDEQRTILPWLAGILIKEAKTQRRKRSRVIDPDRLRQPEPVDASRGALDGELRTCVEAALDRLPTKYARVLRASLLEGANAGEIAAHTGTAPGTVRVQLHRGFDLLRRALPAGLSLGALAALMPRGLTQVREVVLAHGVAHGPLVVGAGAGGSAGLSSIVSPWFSSAGALIMQGKWIAASALLFLVGWGTMHGFQSESHEGSSLADIPAPIEQEPQEDRPPLTALVTADRRTTPVEPTAEQPAPPAERPSDPTNLTEAFAYDSAVLRVQCLGPVSAEPTEFLIEVYLEGGQPIAVHRTPDLGTFELPLTGLPSTTDWGALRPRVLISGAGYLLNSAYAELVSPQKHDQAERSTVAHYATSIELQLIQRWIVGRLVDAEGEPVSTSDSWVVFQQDGQEVLWTDATAQTVTQRKGSFRLPLAHRLPGRLLAHAPGHAVHHQVLPVSSDLEVDVGTIQLDRGSSIRGRVLRAGTPLPVGSIVRASLPRKPVPATYYLQKLQPTPQGAALFEIETDVGENGTFALHGLQAGLEYSLTATPFGDFTTTLDHGEGGQGVRAPAEDVVLDWGKLPLQLVVTGEGTPISNAQVRSIRPAEGAWAGYPIHRRGGWQSPARSDAQGRVHLHLPKDTRVHLEVAADGWKTRYVTVDTTRLPESGALPVELAADIASANLWVTVEGVSPESLANAIAYFYTFDPTEGLKTYPPTPFQNNRAKVTGLRPGTDHIHLSLLMPNAESYADLPFFEQGARKATFAPLPSGQTGEATLRFPRGGRIELQVAGIAAGGEAPQFACIDAQGQRRQPEPIQPKPDGSLQKAPWTTDGPGYLGAWLPPGTYRVSPTHPAYASDEITVEVRPGQVTRAYFALRSAP